MVIDGRRVTAEVAIPSAVANPHKALDLRCPNCGSEFEAELTYTGFSHSEHRDLTGYECENWECNARWDRFGNVERPSKLS